MRIAFTTILPDEGFLRLSHHTLYAPLSDAEVLVSTFDKLVTREMIASAPHLQLITNFGVGFNNIDLDACRERGIRVTNTPRPQVATGQSRTLWRDEQPEPLAIWQDLRYHRHGTYWTSIGTPRSSKWHDYHLSQ